MSVPSVWRGVVSRVVPDSAPEPPSGPAELALQKRRWILRGEQIRQRHAEILTAQNEEVAAVQRDRDQLAAQVDVAGATLQRKILEAAAQGWSPVDYSRFEATAVEQWGTIPPEYRGEHERWRLGRERLHVLNVRLNTLELQRSETVAAIEAADKQLVEWRQELATLEAVPA